MPARELGDRPSHPADSGQTFDGEGYALTTGSDSPDSVAKADSVGDTFVGVNYRERHLPGRHGGLEDGPQVAVQQEGVVNVLCASANYGLGDPVYLSGTAGVANKTDSGSDTRIGTVAKSNDLSGADGPELVRVNITGYV